MVQFSLNIAKSLFLVSRTLEADIKDYGKLPPYDAERLTSPHKQKKDIEKLLSTPPFSQEWMNKNILSGFFKMEASKAFIKKFPEVLEFAQAVSPARMDLFRKSILGLEDSDVNNDYSNIEGFVVNARKILAAIHEILLKFPSDWLEKLQRLTLGFSAVLDEGIKEVSHLKQMRKNKQ